MFVEDSIKGFIEKLASSSPTPGGGSVAALGGALSASLVSMVCNLSKDVEELKPVLEDSNILRAECIKLMDDDASAFDGIMKAFKMPRKTDRDKAARRAAIQDALKGAAKVPLIVAGRCMHVIRLSNTTAKKCNQNAISDIGVAALIAYASVMSAALNVKINLKSIKDEEFLQEVGSEIKDLEEEAEKGMKEVLKYVESVIG
jgi:formiminotetrahydrofolate cyclodeaminase